MNLSGVISIYQTKHLPGIIDRKNVARVLGILERELGSIEVVKLTRKDLLDYRSRRPVSESTKNRELRILNAVLNYAKDNCLVEDFSVSIPMAKEKPKTDFLTEDKVQLLIKHAPNDTCRDFIGLMYLTAQRIEAVRTLTWSQIKDGIIYFNEVEAIHSERMKGRGTIALTPETESILARLKLISSNSKYVFPDTRGGIGPCKTIRAWFQKACDDSGIKSNPHMIRHSSCSNALSKGASIEECSQLLGHSSISITEKVYAHRNPANTKKTSSRLSLMTAAR